MLQNQSPRSSSDQPANELPGELAVGRVSHPTPFLCDFTSSTQSLTFARNAPKLLPRHFPDRRLRSVPCSASLTRLGTARSSSPQRRRSCNSLQASASRSPVSLAL